MITSRKISEIPGMEDYDAYFATMSGEIYSTKHKKAKRIKPGYIRDKNSYQIVKLSDGKGGIKNFYIHRLVAQLFILNPGNCWGIEHINGDLKDNSVNNLRWKRRRTPIYGSSDDVDINRIYLGKEVSNHIKLVHQAAIQKGLPVPDEVDFFNNMINESLEEYINRYGLRKIIYQIQQLPDTVHS